jgi:(E)-4-hydroxy-3-methylbut-2-enyl-diphosphate synthase
MIVEDTADVRSCADAIERLHAAGCELVRVTTPTLRDVAHVAEIRRILKSRGKGKIPLVADIHHNGWKIARAASQVVDKIRINPGLFVFKRRKPDAPFTEEEIKEERERISEQLQEVLMDCRQNGCALRIGVNHGSLGERMLFQFGDTPEGMVESALEFIELCENQGFDQLVVSLKASRVPIMVAANRLLAQRFRQRGVAYPIHLGVTEAGDGQYARIKSAAGMAPLLIDGIGDTIRISLSEDPLKEIPACYDLLQALNLRKTKVEFIACPSCGRTKFNLMEVVPKVRAATEHLVGLDIAIMGCIVNGLGEMADADYGYVGQGVGRISLYRNKTLVAANIPEAQGIDALITLIKEDGHWTEPGPCPNT